MECIVCYNLYNHDNHPYIIDCGHTFCKMCIQNIKFCPLCRTENTKHIKNYAVYDLLIKKTLHNSHNTRNIVFDAIEEMINASPNEENKEENDDKINKSISINYKNYELKITRIINKYDIIDNNGRTLLMKQLMEPNDTIEWRDNIISIIDKSSCDIQDIDGNTALMIALTIFGTQTTIYNDIYIDILKHLIKKTSKKSELSNKYNETSLSIAIIYKHYDLIEYLIDEYSCKKYDNDGLTVLMLLVLDSKNFLLNSNRYYVLKKVIELSDYNARNRDGNNALMMSAINTMTTSTESTVKMLLDMPNIDINAFDNNGRTVLMMASMCTKTTSSENTIKLLLKKSDCNIQRQNGMTALMIAAKYSRISSTDKTIEILSEYTDCNIQDKRGWTALMFAAKASGTTSTIETVKILAKKSDTYMKTNKGWTSLMISASCSRSTSNIETVKLLADAASCEIQNDEGNTALILAALCSNTSSTEETVELLAKITNNNIKNNEGNTALMLASIYCESVSTIKTVKILLQKSDPNIINKEGNTALMLAVKYTKTTSSEDIIPLLSPITDHKIKNINNQNVMYIAVTSNESTENTPYLLAQYMNMHNYNTIGLV